MARVAGCESHTSRTPWILYPPPEDTGSNIDTIDQLNSKIVPNLKPSQEPPTPAGFFYPNDEEDVQLFDIDLECISDHQPKLSPELTCTTTPNPQVIMVSSIDGSLTRSGNGLHGIVGAMRHHPSLTDKSAMRDHPQYPGHILSQFTKKIERSQATDSPILGRCSIPTVEFGSVAHSTQPGQWVEYCESDDDGDEEFAAAVRRDNLGKNGGRRQDLVSQQHSPSPPPLRQLSPIFHHQNTPRFPTSEQILQTSKRPYTVHCRSQQPGFAEIESSRISPVPDSPSRAMHTSRALPTVQKRPMSPTSLFIVDDNECADESGNDTEDSDNVFNTLVDPTNSSQEVAVLAKHSRATGPFDDDSDSDPDAFVKPRRPRLNLLRIKQAIAQNAKDVSNLQGQAKSPTRVEVPVSITNKSINIQIQEKNNGVTQLTRFPNAQAKETKRAEAATIGATPINSNFAGPQFGVQKLGPRPTMAAPAKGNQNPEFKMVDTMWKLETESVAGPQLDAQKIASRPITALPVTGNRKTSLQTGEANRNGSSVEVARSSMSAHKLANRPGNQVPEKVNEQNTPLKQVSKRPGSHVVASTTKKQKTMAVPIAIPPPVNSLAALLEDLVPTDKAPIAPKKKPASIPTARSSVTPKLATLNSKKAHPVPLKVSSTIRSATPTSSKRASIAPKLTPVTKKPAPITTGSVALRNAPVPQKEAMTTPRRAPVPKPAQITLKAAPRAPQTASSTSNISLVSKTASGLPNAASAPLKTTATTQAGPFNQKTTTFGPQTATSSQRATPITIQASPIAQKGTSVTEKSAVAPQNAVQVTRKEIPAPAKRSPAPKEASSISEKTPVTKETTRTPPKDLPNTREVNIVLPSIATSTPIELASAILSQKESPFFEYTVFQKTIPPMASESCTPSIELGTHTDIDAANAQAEALHRAAAHQHPLVYDIQFSAWSKNPDSFDCLTFHGTFAPTEYPTRTSHLKIWVERHAASAYTDRVPLPKPHFLAKNVFILRLRRLVEAADDNNSDDDVDDDDDDDDTMDTDEEHQPLRVYQALPEGFAELYTTPDAANRAARRVQIEMSHEKESKSQNKDSKHQGMRMWQETNRRELLERVAWLEKASKDGDRMGCWESQFNEAGLGGDRFELVVERVRLLGPRNM